MANIDRILNVHQTYSLTKVSALNKQILIAQYAQIEQISKLEKEIQRSNEISREILHNQLRELKHKESLRYYKEIVFNMHEAISIIEKTDNQPLKLFLCDLYIAIIENNVENIKSNLEEIPDKEFCSKIIERVGLLKDIVLENKTSYLNSDFKMMLDSQNDFEVNAKKLRKQQFQLNAVKNIVLHKDKSSANLVQKPLGNKSRGCFIKILWFLLSVFILLAVMSAFDDIEVFYSFLILFILPISAILFFVKRADIKWRNNYSQYLDEFNTLQNPGQSHSNAELTEQELLVQGMQVQLNEHPYMKLKMSISQLLPNWENVVEKIYNLIPKPTKKEVAQKTDALFADVARYVVKKQQGSTSVIQRQFSVGYNRAGRIMEDLEKMGVTGKQQGSKPREVLICDLEILEEVIDTYYNFEY